MTQYISNHTPTSGLGGWARTAGSLTATSDGARWTTSDTDAYVTVTASTPPPNGTLVYVAGVQVRRNTSASSRPQYMSLRCGGSAGYSRVDLDGVDFPVGTWVTIPTIALTNIWLNVGPTTLKDFYVFLGGPVSGSLDCTFRYVRAYNAGYPADASVTSADAAFTWPDAGNSLSRTFSRTASTARAVAGVEWDWGDGSAKTSGPVVGSGQKSSGVTHAYAAAGVRAVSLKVFSPPRTSSNSGWTAPATPVATASRSVTVPTGPFQAAFDHQVSYPELLVDASPSIAPSLSPVETYAWNWGDGTTGSGKTTSHTYASPGVYNVTLTISNSVVQRTSSITKSVMIAAPDLASPAEQFAMALFLDDPASVVTSSGLQAEMVPIVVADEIKWNWTGNEIPTLSFRAPHDWLEQTAPGVTLENLRSDIVLRLNFGNGWVEPPMARFIVDTVNSDPLNPQSLVTVKGLGIAADDLAGLFFTPEIVGDAYTSAERAAGYSRLYSTVNPGAILWDLLPVATTPGSGAPHLNYLNIDFSATLDSKGASWAHTLESVKVPPDSSGLDLLQNLIDLEAIDWYCRGNLLRVFNPGSSGVRGPSDSPPELLPGRDIKAAPQEQAPIRSKCWGAVVIGDKGVPYTVSDTVGSNESYQRAAYRGRRYVAIQAGDVASSAGALATAKPPLANIYRTRDGEMVRELILGSNSPWMPYRDYHVGDVVLAPGPNGTLEVVSVVAITLTQSATVGIEGALILGNAYAVNGITKKIASLAGGSGISVGKARSTEGDTGWVTITPSSGYGFQSGYPLGIRRVGNLVKTRGLLTRTGGWTAGTQFTGVIAAIPAEFRPSQGEFFSGAGNTSHPNPVIIWNADGSLAVRTQSTVTPWVGIGASWFV